MADRYNHSGAYATGHFKVAQLKELNGEWGYVVDTHYSEVYPTIARDEDFEYRSLKEHADSVEVVGIRDRNET